MPVPKGFLAGCSDCTIFIYDKHEGDIKRPYIRAERIIKNIDCTAKISSLLLSNNDENLIIGAANG